MGVSIKATGVKELMQTLKMLPKETERGLIRTLEKTATILLRAARAEASGPSIKVRTGFTRASIYKKVSRGTATASVGSDKNYMGVLEEGGTIFPRTSEFLAVPVPNTPAVDRAPNDFVNRFVVSGARGLVLMGSTAEGAEPQPLFALKPFVHIKAHHTFRNAITRADGLINAAFEKSAEEAIKRANKK